MGKQSRSKKQENFGKGKVTPVQVAFIVDRYLSDNNYPETRSVFRTEASTLIAKSPAGEAPRSLLSLGAMLDEYICLKEQKVFVEQERANLEQEKVRVTTLLQGMQNVMNVYNASANLIPNAAPGAKSVAAPLPAALVGSQPGHNVFATTAVAPVAAPSKLVQHRGHFSTPVLTQTSARNKRVLAPAMEHSAAAKKTRRSKPSSANLPSQGTDTLPETSNAVRSQLNGQPLSVTQSSSQDFGANGMAVQMSSSVAKCLFNQKEQSTPFISSDPNTPPQSSQSDKSSSPIGIEANCGNSNSPEEITPTNCTIISTERAILTPSKQMTCYTIERSHRISSCSPAKSNLKRLGRDHVKGRLDFGGADATENLDQPITDITAFESQNQGDYFDIDFNMDAFGENFNFSELLLDLDLGCEGIDFPCQPTSGASADTPSGSSHESGDGNPETNQFMSEFSSTVTEVMSEKDGTTQGPETVTSVKSITKCIRILSPVKGCKSSPGKQNCNTPN